MFGFLIKKTFFDMWDNLLRVFVLNVGFYALALPVLPLIRVIVSAAGETASLWLTPVAGFVLLAPLFVYAGAASMAAKEMVDYRTVGFASFLSGLRHTYRSSLVFAAINVIGGFAISIGLGFYGQLGGGIGLLGRLLLVWITVAWLCIGPLYYAVQGRLDTKTRKILRKSGLIFLDNTPFVLLLNFFALMIAVASVPVAGMLLGATTLLIWYQAALKLRLLKYDYLEENPDANRRRIPWDALLIEERERVGIRTLRGMIFPWKE